MPNPVCKRCIVDEHARLPFHCIEEHNGKFFKACSLSSVGLSVNLMHDTKACPHSDDGVQTTVVHTNGVHSIRVKYCDCVGRPEKVVQLTKQGLFPATAKNPRTLFTFELLKDFHLHTRVSKKSAYDYLRATYRKTAISLLGDTSVSKLVYPWLKQADLAKGAIPAVPSCFPNVEVVGSQSLERASIIH